MKEIIYPVFTERGRCLTEMYAGFDYTKHIVKTERRNGPVTSNFVKPAPTRKRRPTSKVKVRSAAHTIGFIRPTYDGRGKTAAELGLKVTPTGDGI